jgi:hypothetical protein
MPNFKRYLLTIVEFTGLACVSIFCISLIYVIFSMTTSGNQFGILLYNIGLRDVAQIFLQNKSSRNLQDIQLLGVETDNSTVSKWVLDCLKAKSVDDVPTPLAKDFLTVVEEYDYDRQIPLAGASHCWKVQPVDPMRFLNSAAVRCWVQNGMA